MKNTPIRHMLFLTALLFVILSSGSLQCALNCYDRAAQVTSPQLVADCHPLVLEELTHSPVANFCHHGNAAADVGGDPVLKTLAGGQGLALSQSRGENPECRNAEPFRHKVATLFKNNQTHPEILPLSQNLKQLRSTILLM